MLLQTETSFTITTLDCTNSWSSDLLNLVLSHIHSLTFIIQDSNQETFQTIPRHLKSILMSAVGSRHLKQVNIIVPDPIQNDQSTSYRTLELILNSLHSSTHIKSLHIKATLLQPTPNHYKLPTLIKKLKIKPCQTHYESNMNIKNKSQLILHTLHINHSCVHEWIHEAKNLTSLTVLYNPLHDPIENIDAMRRNYATNRSIKNLIIKHLENNIPHTDLITNGFGFYECVGWLPHLEKLNIQIHFSSLGPLFNPLILSSMFDSIRSRNGWLRELTLCEKTLSPSCTMTCNTDFTNDLLCIVLAQVQNEMCKMLRFKVQGVILFQIICQTIKKRLGSVELCCVELRNTKFQLYIFEFICTCAHVPIVFEFEYKGQELTNNEVERVFQIVETLTGVSYKYLLSQLNHFNVSSTIRLDGRILKKMIKSD
ncbi:hypothetical protein AKO1_013360 [Acrasis kona]|uniref:Uncharacterized protein n=1 Tax=Acrasis kona TaxID=1008807 RepID=A0AAW2YZG8_9EUKA